MTQHITLAELKSKCLEAYNAKRLLAQSSYRTPAYRIGEYVCAIGAAMSEETLQVIGDKADNAITEHLITVSGNEFHKIKDIYDAHNNWWRYRTKAREKQFLALINK